MCVVFGIQSRFLFITCKQIDWFFKICIRLFLFLWKNIILLKSLASYEKKWEKIPEESWGYFTVHLFRNWAWQRCVWYSLVAGRSRSPQIPPPRGPWWSGTWQVRRTTACLLAGWWWKRLNGNWFMQQAGAGLETICLLLQLYHLKLLKNQCSSLNLHNYINEFFDGD